MEPCCCVFTSDAAVFSDAFLAAASPFSPTGIVSPVAGAGDPDCVAVSASDKGALAFSPGCPFLTKSTLFCFKNGSGSIGLLFLYNPK